MKWASAVSAEQNLEGAIEECVSSVRQNLGDVIPDLVVAFASGHFAARHEESVGFEIGGIALVALQAHAVISPPGTRRSRRCLKIGWGLPCSLAARPGA